MQTIYTWGYRGSTHDRLRQLIAEHDIRLIIDVRRDPWGGLGQWREGPMREAFGDSYMTRWGLGNRGTAKPGEWLRVGKEMAANAIRELRTEYEFGDGSHVPMLLLCCEADANDCHRKHVAEAIAEGTELQIVHLPGKAAKAKTGNLFAEEGAGR